MSKSKLSPSLPIFIFSPFISLPFILVDVYKKRKIGLIMFALFMGILAYLYLPNLTQDGAKRYLLYEGFQGKSFDVFLSSYLAYRVDFIYYLLIYWFAYFNIKFQLLLFVLAVINVGVPLFFYQKLIERYELPSRFQFHSFLLVVFTLWLGFLFSGVRNMVGFSLVEMGFYLVFFRKKIIVPFVLLALGVFTHFSMVIYIPIFLAANFLRDKAIFAILALTLSIGLLIPGDSLQEIMFSVGPESELLEKKIVGYTEVKVNKESTQLTQIAKVLSRLWFYISILYILVVRSYSTKLRQVYLLFLIPVAFFFLYPGISGRYTFALQIAFALLLIEESILRKKLGWFYLFFFLFMIRPLYSILRLLTDSLIAGFLNTDSLTLIQIINKTYTYADMLIK